ncbi:hypothetical protein [Aquimarina pacifica]|uniref:hypothetical protein n=1 Tax=Aquimarina pacifica TaxID=1296415 RepID=UPI00046EDD04|nr:hypothetical protein [Aquimarina pacifica]
MNLSILEVMQTSTYQFHTNKAIGNQKKRDNRMWIFQDFWVLLNEVVLLNLALVFGIKNHIITNQNHQTIKRNE